MVPIEALSTQFLRTLPKRTPCYSVKQTGFSVPLDNEDADMALAQDCRVLLIDDQTTGYYNGTWTHSTNCWVAFLASVYQRRVLEHPSHALIDFSGIFY